MQTRFRQRRHSTRCKRWVTASRLVKPYSLAERQQMTRSKCALSIYRRIIIQMWPWASSIIPVFFYVDNEIILIVRIYTHINVFVYLTRLRLITGLIIIIIWRHLFTWHFYCVIRARIRVLGIGGINENQYFW